MSEATATEIIMPKHGDFCWTEIASNNLESCKNFYSNVFGWEMKESNSIGEAFEYQEFSAASNSFPMGGMYQISEEMCGGKELPPPHFMNYISVNNVDESASKAFDLGGKIVSAPMDIPNVGRFTIIQDPTGAHIALITLKEGGPQVNTSKHGEICWRELHTQNVEKAKNFYQELLGLKLEQSKTSTMAYDEIYVDDNPIGGMMQINEEWGEGWEEIPAHWTTYVAVDNCDSIVGIISENGGSICVPPFDIENIGRMAVANDPDGATFSVIQLIKQ